MAKQIFLNLVNKILPRIDESVITDVSTANGKALIVINLINEAQNTLYTEGINWYDLYTTETITTIASIAEYSLPASHGRTLVMINETSNWVMLEEFIKSIDDVDPDRSATSPPTHFTIQGSNYRFYPIPSSVETIRVRYYKVPSTMIANSDVSDLPIECENVLIQFAWYLILEYIKDYDGADRMRIRYEASLKKAKIANGKILDRLYKFQPDSQRDGIRPPKFPSNYGRIFR